MVLGGVSLPLFQLLLSQHAPRLSLVWLLQAHHAAAEHASVTTVAVSETAMTGACLGFRYHHIYLGKQWNMCRRHKQIKVSPRNGII